MQPTEQLTVILPAISELVDMIEPAQLHNPTPCTNFVLSDVLDGCVPPGGGLRGDPRC
jgi:hypothetical protein